MFVFNSIMSAAEKTNTKVIYTGGVNEKQAKNDNLNRGKASVRAENVTL